jgi:hypothetical protein
VGEDRDGLSDSGDCKREEKVSMEQGMEEEGRRNALVLK